MNIALLKCKAENSTVFIYPTKNGQKHDRINAAVLCYGFYVRTLLVVSLNLPVIM
jgi:hypothetical protein